MSASSMPRTAGLIENGIGEGLHPGAQIYVSREGSTIADFAAGEASEGVPMTTASLMGWMSSGKPLLAVAVGQLQERGCVGLGDRVTDYIPEFSAHDKGDITIDHLLTHTSGLQSVQPQATTWDELVATICEGAPQPGWSPGSKAGYNVSNGWVILAEIVRRVDGRHYDVFARDDILRPTGMKDSWVHLKAAEMDRYGDRVAKLYNTEGGERRDPGWTRWSEELYWPGGSAIGPIRELGYFYEMLLQGGRRRGESILSTETVREFTTRRRCGMADSTFGYVLDWGLGFMLDSKEHGQQDYAYSFGEHAASLTFGHGGYQSSMGFADPTHGLAVAWALNGMPGERAHRPRNFEINTAIYEDLGLR